MSTRDEQDSKTRDQARALAIRLMTMVRDGAEESVSPQICMLAFQLCLETAAEVHHFLSPSTSESLEADFVRLTRGAPWPTLRFKIEAAGDLEKEPSLRVAALASAWTALSACQDAAIQLCAAKFVLETLAAAARALSTTHFELTQQRYRSLTGEDIPQGSGVKVYPMPSEPTGPLS